MKKLVNSPYLKEKGFLGPFSLIEALVVIALSFLTYIISCYCEGWLNYNRLWTISLTCIMVILSFFVKTWIKHSNPTWLSSIFSYHFLHSEIDHFSIKSNLNAFLKESQERRIR